MLGGGGGEAGLSGKLLLRPPVLVPPAAQNPVAGRRAGGGTPHQRRYVGFARGSGQVQNLHGPAQAAHVRVAVDKARIGRRARQVQHHGPRAGQRRYLLPGAGGHHPVAPNGQGGHDRTLRVQCVDDAVLQDPVRRFIGHRDAPEEGKNT